MRSHLAALAALLTCASACDDRDGGASLDEALQLVELDDGDPCTTATAGRDGVVRRPIEGYVAAWVTVAPIDRDGRAPVAVAVRPVRRRGLRGAVAVRARSRDVAIAAVAVGDAAYGDHGSYLRGYFLDGERGGSCVLHEEAPPRSRRRGLDRVGLHQHP